MFIATLYTIAKNGSNLISINRGVDKEDVHIHYTAVKRNEIMAFAATWMDLEISMLNVVSQTVRHKCHMPSSYVESKKKGYNELLCSTDTDSQTLKKLRLPKETGCRGRDRLGVWDGNDVKLGYDDHCTTINIIKFAELKSKNYLI